MSFLRDETKKRGFATADGVHMGPCEIHRRTPTPSAPTARCSPAPALPARRCSRPATSTSAQEAYRTQAQRNFEKLAAWEQCHDCAFIPVCAGGCTVAAHNELGDMHAPNCHKTSFEAGVVAMAHDVAMAGASQQSAVSSLQ